MALYSIELDTCGGCGQPRSESHLRENEFGYTAEPDRCHACATITRASRQFMSDAGTTTGDGVTFHVHKD
jgi:hypothetical protein